MHDELTAFCQREHGRLVAALDLACGSYDMAEDLAQETLARICRNWGRVQSMDAPGAYAHRIAMNLAASRFRRRAAERRAVARHEADQDESWHDPDSAEAVAVRDALQSLRPEQRRVLVCRYFLGYSVDETAGVLGMPVGTVKTHAYRGLAQLRAIFGESLAADGMVTGDA